jgi:hypothetical protein
MPSRMKPSITPIHNSWRSTRIPTVYFPRKPGESPEPVPYVLTADEVVRFTRLDETSAEFPERNLAHYRKMGALRGTQIGWNVRYTLPDVLDFVEMLKELNPK